ncbi:disulfide bond formation protein B [Salmonella enterica]|nr:disulfide bond formation protein B [Salmonella enterica]EEU3908435.1 disulfide bond formation protein B [Salmonella enterica]EGY4577541.1 disulfide bond formation protein B [Salmonella enterica]EGY4584365.1 disulfide bond formation protein B [Salmonella enterica]EGY9841625.1 disulfide bond formation protein B [Salmonella enterica]
MKEKKLLHLMPEIMNVAFLIIVTVALLTAFYYQIFRNELPCPLCLMQRAGFITAGTGAMLNIIFGRKNINYGLVTCGALVVGIIGVRQVLLNIQSGGSGFGSPFIGLHLYTWSVLMSVMMIVGVAITLMMEISIQKTPGKTLIPAWCGRYVCYFFALVIAANVVSTLLECGIGQCDGDTYYYRLLSYHEKLNNGGLSMPENYFADIGYLADQ